MKINKYNKHIIMFTLRELKDEIDFIESIKLFNLCKGMIIQIENEIAKILKNENNDIENSDLLNAIKEGLIIDNNTFDYVRNYLLFSLYTVDETSNQLKNLLYQNDILRFNIISKKISIEEIKVALLHSVIVKDKDEEDRLKKLLNELYNDHKEEISIRDLIIYGIDLCSYISYFGKPRFESKIFESGLAQSDEKVLIFNNGTFKKIDVK